MKLGVSRISDEQRQRVITLRRNNSLSKVSELVGLPLGTVKTIHGVITWLAVSRTWGNVTPSPPIIQLVDANVSY